MTHLHMQTVMMASIITVWTTWHAAMSLPAHSIALRCAWRPLLSLWAACYGGGWVAVDDGAWTRLVVVSVCECHHVGGVVVDGGVLIRFVAWCCHVVSILVVGGCEWPAVEVGVGGCWQWW